MEVVGFFMLGFPGETEGDIMKTIELACSLDLKNVSFAFCQPLPGTEMNRMFPKPIKADWHYSKVAFVPEGMTYRKLKSLQRKAYMQFFIVKGRIWRLLKEIRSFQQFIYILKRAWDYMA